MHIPVQMLLNHAIRMVIDHSAPTLFQRWTRRTRLGTHRLSMQSSVSESGGSHSGTSMYADNAQNVYATPSQLAAFLSTRVVALNEHFVLIDKPAGLSVWGHSLLKREAMLALGGKPQSISINDCLPQLAKLLDPRWNSTSPLNSCTLFHHREGNFAGSETEPSASPNPSLLIAKPLPAEYSGLILLARTAEYARFAEKFYQSATRAKPHWYLYQRFLALCRGQAARTTAPAEKFPVASYRLNEHLSCGYRPAPNELSRSNRRKGLILCKYVGHQLLATNATGDSLICLQANSSYRGLPELYLLHEGCTVVGETIQSSRLLDTGMGKVVLHPSQANFRVSQSTVQQKSQRTSADSSPEPVHLHRASLLIPIPLRGCNSKAPDFFRPSVPNPRGSIQSPNSKSNVLRWCRLSHPAASREDAMQYALLCISPSLPTYFTRKINELGFNFDYATWIDSCEYT